MTRPEGAGDGGRIILKFGPITQEHLDACARVLARLAVGKAVEYLGLDFGEVTGDAVGNPHKSGPAGAVNTDRAKELVL